MKSSIVHKYEIAVAFIAYTATLEVHGSAVQWP